MFEIYGVSLNLNCVFNKIFFIFKLKSKTLIKNHHYITTQVNRYYLCKSLYKNSVWMSPIYWKGFTGSTTCFSFVYDILDKDNNGMQKWFDHFVIELIVILWSCSYCYSIILLFLLFSYIFDIILCFSSYSISIVFLFYWDGYIWAEGLSRIIYLHKAVVMSAYILPP